MLPIAPFGGGQKRVLYRITGPQSIDRLGPLLGLLGPPEADVAWEVAELGDCSRIDFVWETACEKLWRDRHLGAAVLNRLNNSAILEDKSNLAFLQLKMSVPSLETYIASCREEFLRWASRRWPEGDREAGTRPVDASDWWAVKAAKGNGGKDVWIANQNNFKDIFSVLPKHDELVIQKYVNRPRLWRGKKFHMRCYGLILASLTPMLYEKCFLLTAGRDYQTETADMTSHITNLSVNKHLPGHPGQVPCDIPAEFPVEFENIKRIWANVVEAASDYMLEQCNRNNFEFYGIDVIADEDGCCWLIELNRLPGLESSKINTTEEDMFYNEMMLSVLQIVTKPIFEIDTSDPAPVGRWCRVGSPNPQAKLDSPSTWKNLFRWKIFTTKNKSSLIACAASPC